MGLLLLLRVLIPMIHQMRHDVVRQGAVPCLGAALGVHGVLGVAELVEQVEGFVAERCTMYLKQPRST